MNAMLAPGRPSFVRSTRLYGQHTPPVPQPVMSPGVQLWAPPQLHIWGTNGSVSSVGPAEPVEPTASFSAWIHSRIAADWAAPSAGPAWAFLVRMRLEPGASVLTTGGS